MRVLVQVCDEDRLGDYSQCTYRGKTEPRYCDALIAPNGTFYDVGAGGHNHAAYEHGATTVEQLEAEGWIHFSTGYFFRSPIVNDVDATQAQLDTLFDIVVAMGQGRVAIYAVPEWVQQHQQQINAFIRKGVA
jgi:hypothetical protein